MRRVPILSLFLFVCASPAQGSLGRYQVDAVAIEIGGRTICLRGSSGGEVVGEVAARPGPDRWLEKSVGNTHFEPIRLQCDPNDMPGEVRGFFDGKAAPLNFNVLQMDATRKVVGKMVVTNAVITKVEIGEFNAANRDVVIMTITLQPGSVQLEQGDGRSVQDAKGKRSASTNFRVAIPGLETRGVSAVGPIVIEQKGEQVVAGRLRELAKTVAGGLDAANLHLQVNRAQAQGFTDWARSFLIEGKRGEADQKTLTVELLSPDMKTVLLTLEARGTGPVAVREQASGGNAERLAQVDVELYVSRWSAK